MKREDTARPLDALYGPIPLEPFSWQVVPWDKLPVAPVAESIKTNLCSIETDFYQLTFNPVFGQLTGLLDKKLDRQVLDPGSRWGFFQLVHERPASRDRQAFHVRSVEDERYGLTGWRPDWQALRTIPALLPARWRSGGVL